MTILINLDAAARSNGAYSPQIRTAAIASQNGVTTANPIMAPRANPARSDGFAVVPAEFVSPRDWIVPLGNDGAAAGWGWSPATCPALSAACGVGTALMDKRGATL